MKSCTFHNWGSKEDEVCIDYMLTSKTGFNVNSYKVVTETYDGAYVSDHYQLRVNLELVQWNPIESEKSEKKQGKENQHNLTKSKKVRKID